MLKTLGLDDDWEPVDVVIAVEKSFDVKISDAEATAILRVGELYDLLIQKLAGNDGNRKCASAMAFYRLRRAMAGLVRDAKASPSFDLMPLRETYTRKLAKSLEAVSGLRLPQPSFTSVGKVGGTVALIGGLGAVATLVIGFVLVFLSIRIGDTLVGFASAFLFGGLIIGVALMGLDRGRLPTDCATLGALAARAGNLSYGRLIKEGANTQKSCIWKALVEVLGDFANVPADQIARETYFLKHTAKKANAAA